MSTSTPSATLADADRQAIMRDAFHAGISASSQSVLDILDQFPDDPEFAVACIRRTVEGRTRRAAGAEAERFIADCIAGSDADLADYDMDGLVSALVQRFQEMRNGIDYGNPCFYVHTAPIPARTRDDLTMYLADADESGVSDFWGTVDAYERP